MSNNNIVTTSSQVNQYLNQVLSDAIKAGTPYDMKAISAKCPDCKGDFLCLKDEKCWCNLPEFVQLLTRVPKGTLGCICQMSLTSLPEKPPEIPQPQQGQQQPGMVVEQQGKRYNLIKAIKFLDKKTKALNTQDTLFHRFLVEKGILKQEDLDEFIKRLNEELNRKNEF